MEYPHVQIRKMDENGSFSSQHFLFDRSVSIPGVFQDQETCATQNTISQQLHIPHDIIWSNYNISPTWISLK